MIALALTEIVAETLFEVSGMQATHKSISS